MALSKLVLWLHNVVVNLNANKKYRYERYGHNRPSDFLDVVDDLGNEVAL